MNLEQIVKETVAKIVAEKELTAAEEKKREEIVKAMKKDFKGPAPAMYAIATDKAKKVAEGEDHEVAMAQDSLDSVIRAAMELKARLGDDEKNIPAWIQDHITNSENYIYQAAKSYHEYNAEEGGAEEMDEAKESNDDKIEKYEKYTYTLNGEIVKPEITFLNNILKAMLGNKIYNIGTPENGKVELTPESGKKGTYTEEMDEANLGHNETSSIEQEGRFWIVTYNTADGTKEKSFESEDEARKFYNTLDEAFQPKSSFDDYSVGDNVTVAGKKAKITNMKMDDETGERRARVKFEDGTVKEVNMNSLDETQLEEAMAKRQNIAQMVAQKYGNQLTPVRDEYIASNEKWHQTISQYKANTPEFNEVNKEHSKIANGFKNMALNAAAKEMKAMGMSDTQIRNYFSEYGPFEDWVHDFMDELMDALDGSQSNGSQELDEATVRRWQHYAGIK